MAKARMLHQKISRSLQVNRLSLSAKLLFTWMIAHADDEGRLRGEPEFVKATVVPMSKWSHKRIEKYLQELKNEKLIYYWQENDDWVVEFVKWNSHQTIRKDRFTPSDLPGYNNDDDNQKTTSRQPAGNHQTTQANKSEANRSELNKSESKSNGIAEKDYKGNGIINPKNFKATTKGEIAALEAWKKLEPFNPLAFKTTYLEALKRGLPSDRFYVFCSEIRQDNSIENPGAVFNQKVKSYLESRSL
jgi:hypothetical protein